MKGGVPNAELAMKKLLKHMKSVYQIPQKIKRLTDHREKSLIRHEQVVMAVLIFLLLQYESFHTIFSAPESMKKRLKHVITGRIPKVDAVRDVHPGVGERCLPDIGDGDRPLSDHGTYDCPG